jgi:pentatricopeptide repeat protein
MARWLICRNFHRHGTKTRLSRLDDSTLASVVVFGMRSGYQIRRYPLLAALSSRRTTRSGSFGHIFSSVTTLHWDLVLGRSLSSRTTEPSLPTKNSKQQQQQQDDGIHSKWQVLSDRHPAAMDDGHSSWQEMEKSLKFWVIQGDARATNHCFHLLDLICRHSREMLQKTADITDSTQTSTNAPKFNTAHTISTHRLNQIVDTWRKLVKQRKQGRHDRVNRKHPQNTLSSSRKLQDDDPSSLKRLLSPSQVAERVERYRHHIPSIRPDVKTYSMILDACSCWEDNPTEGYLFADDLLNRLIDEYNQSLQQKSTAIGSSKSSRNNVVQPDAFAFGSVIYGWSRSGLREAPQRAEAWLRRIKELRKHHPSWKKDLKLNKVLYTSVIMASSQAADVHRAEQVLEDLVQDYQRHRMDGDEDGAKRLKPDIHVFNAVLSGWSHVVKSKSSQNKSPYFGSERAESLFSKMQQLHHSGDLDEGPNTMSYNMVLECWAQSARPGQKHAPERAEALLRAMASSSSSVTPTDWSYNMVIAAYSRAGDAHKAEELLKEMIEAYQGGNVHVKPDVRTFSSILAAYAREATSIETGTANPRERVKATADIAERAEALLRRMQELHQSGQFDIQPNVRTYSSVIACWAQASSRYHHNTANGASPADRAEVLLREMKQNDDPTVQPDVVTYTNVLNAFARTGLPDRAENLLEEMLTDCASGNRYAVQPNVHAFTCVISAYSNRSTPDAAERAERLLTRMKALYESGKVDTCKPNVVTYTAVLNCFANLASPTRTEFADQAQSMLESMKASGDPHVFPTATSYGATIKGHAHAGQAAEAEKLLEEMIHESQLNGNNQVRPDAHTFSLVLSAWSNSSLPSAAESAEALLVRMEELHASGMVSSKPNVFCYSSVLNCWAKSKLDGAAERAEAILRSMAQRDATVQPNIVAYNTVLNCFANKAIAISVRAQRQQQGHGAQERAAKEVDDAVERALILLEELLDQSAPDLVHGGGDKSRPQHERKDTKKHLVPDEHTYHAILKAVGSLHDHQLAQSKLERILNVMKRHGVTPNKAIRDLLQRIKSRHSK